MIRAALLGAGFIGQMHSLSLRSNSFARTGAPIPVELLLLLERPESRLIAEEVQRRYGWQHLVLGDSERAAVRPDIDLFINAGPNDAHAATTIAAAKAGKAVFCEKPLAATAEEAFAIWQAAEQAGVAHMCAYIHRFVPALHLARDMIAGGAIGEVRHFRSQLLLNMEEPALTWRFSRGQAGGGATGDLGSHHVDLARFLVAEVDEVAATTRTWSTDPAKRITDVNDDSFSAVAHLANGALATFEASRLAPGHALTGRVEVDGTRGTLAWCMERLNELVVSEPGKGPRTVLATRPGHPNADFFLPIGIQGAFPVSWRDCFVYQMHHLLGSIASKAPVGPLAATFRDGYRVAEIVDAMLRSTASRRFEKVAFRGD